MHTPKFLASALVALWLGGVHRLGGRGAKRLSEHSIGEQVLLGMSFLRHFELAQRGRSLTVRAPPTRRWDRFRRTTWPLPLVEPDG